MIDASSRGVLIRSFNAVPLALSTRRSPAILARDDGELLRLCDLLLNAWAEETRACHDPAMSGEGADAAYSAVAVIVDRIVGLRAASVAGLTVKALACAWCHNDYGGDFAPESLGGKATDVRLAAGIIRDLLAMRPTEGGEA